ncbi:MAG: hypothetical protein SFU91_02515 [Chloroherpetonaceae bacterium]|nr:hypothetical protein [Chloroherpetonaceae bacterium]
MEFVKSIFSFQLNSFWVDVLILTVVFILGIFLFVRLELKGSGNRGWFYTVMFILLGFGIGGIAWRRKRLFEELKKREEEIAAMEKRYDELKRKAEISDAEYQAASERLKQSKLESAEAIANADESLRKRVEEIKKHHETITPEELYDEIKKILGTPAPQ